MTVIRGRYFGTGPPGAFKSSGQNLGSMAYFLIGRTRYHYTVDILVVMSIMIKDRS